MWLRPIATHVVDDGHGRKSASARHVIEFRRHVTHGVNMRQQTGKLRPVAEIIVQKASIIVLQQMN